MSAHPLGRRFTDEEDYFVMARIVNDAELADALGRTVAAIRSRRQRIVHPDRRLRTRKRNYAQTEYAPNHRKPWTESEVRALLAWEGTDRDLSAKLGRSVMAIQHHRLRITTGGAS